MSTATKKRVIRNVKISGTGSYAPEGVYTNEHIETIVDTNAQWVYENLGIKERHIVAKGETTSDIGAKAALKAIANANISPEDIDLIICATTTPDMHAPSTACFIQEKIGAFNAGAFDVSAVCTGFLYAISLATDCLSNGNYKNILVIGADTFSTITDWTRRDCVFFGDGAGAVVLSREDADTGFVISKVGADGRGKMIWHIPAGGSQNPINETTAKDRLQYWQMDGKGIYNEATRVLPKVITEVLSDSGLKLDDIKYMIPHQPSFKILKKTAELINFDIKKVLTNMDRYGNTSAASIPILLDETNKAGKLKADDYLLFAAVGSGMAWGAMILKW
jgi:3-oxoacyl-[acyl-carrier-protein] synthase III